MATLKVKFVLNKGRRGAPLGKLGMISDQAEAFLVQLAKECDVRARPGEWLAVDFKNGSLEYNAEYQGDIPPGVAQIFANKLEFLADYDPEAIGLNGTVSERTALEYAKIGQLIDPDEVIGIGIYSGRGGKPKMRQISYNKSAAIKRELESSIATHGAVQGIVHSWQKEARSPSFFIRELSTNNLVRVFYKPQFYRSVVEAVQERNTVVIASGHMLLDRISKSTIEMRLDRIEPVSILSASEFEEFVGSAPEYEIDLSEESYIGDLN